MAISVETALGRISVNSAAVAAAMGAGTTSAEVDGLVEVLTVLIYRPDLMFQVMQLANTTQITRGT